MPSKRRSRRRPVRGFISYKHLPSQSYIADHILYDEVSRIQDTRQAMRVLENNIAKFLNGLEDYTPEALQYALEPTFELSQKYCPIDTGVLRESGYFEVGTAAVGPKAEIGYAPRNNPPYGIYVHERVDLNHKAPTRAKWLQSAMEETLDDMLPRVREYLRGTVGVS